METLLLRWAVAALAVLLPLGPVAAAPPAPAPAPAGGMGWGQGSGRRSADAHFIVMMIPHHEGAIAMAELALVRARHPELRALAQRIRSSQSRENAQMRSWYRQWFAADVPVWPGMGMGMGAGMGMGPGYGMGMGGPVTSLDALRVAPDFDKAFLEQMIAHHRMGVHMASHAQWNTLHPELRALEQAMVRVQTQEIAQMEQWYQAWFGKP